MGFGVAVRMKAPPFNKNIFSPSHVLWLGERFIHPAAREGDQAACAHTKWAPAPLPAKGGVWPAVLDGVCRTVTDQSLASCAEARDGWG